jgi:cell pole-organizing protein PopZ
MSDEQNNQSVKDILEDIKKAISSSDKNDDVVEIDDEDNDILHLDEEYLQNDEESNKKDNQPLQDQNKKVNYNDVQLDQSFKVEKEIKSYNQSNMLHKTQSDVIQSDNHLILEENMEEIKILLKKMQNELQQKQQTTPNLTIEELVMSLLKPGLSEWLNKNLYKLVREVVEKELKDIVNK